MRAASADTQSMLSQPSGGRADFERKLLFDKVCLGGSTQELRGGVSACVLLCWHHLMTA